MLGSQVKTLRYAVILGLFHHLCAYAINPVPGAYAGVFLGPTFAPNIDFTTTQDITLFSNLLTTSYTIPADTPISLQYSVLGGIGGEVGYRFCTKFRAEIEVFYNNNPFTQLQLGNQTIDSVSASVDLHIGGDTNTGAGLVNIFYDLLTPSRDYYGAVFPYVGLGLGYAYVQNSLQFHYNTPEYLASNPSPTSTTSELDFTKAFATYAGQAIIGIGYFLDDFTWLSADIRYFSTGKKTVNASTTALENSSGTPYTASFIQQTKLLSIMVSFNGAFDLG